MANIADAIEQFILSRLSDQRDHIIILQRNELADELDCAPSQISYVVNTRFTVERGFIVESRRGSGGYIRIIRVLPSNIIYGAGTSENDAGSKVSDIEEIIARLYSQSHLTRREAALLTHFLGIMREHMDLAERVEMLRALLLTLTNYS
jgi:transcriptional regulator of stress and heat shock response